MKIIYFYTKLHSNTLIEQSLFEVVPLHTTQQMVYHIQYCVLWETGGDNIISQEFGRIIFGELYNIIWESFRASMGF